MIETPASEAVVGRARKMMITVKLCDWFLDQNTHEGTVTFSASGSIYEAFSQGHEYHSGEPLDVTISHLAGDTHWDERFTRNREKKKCLVKTGTWSYDAFGEIVGLNPIVADFGPFTLELGNWSHDPKLIGTFIFWRIGRLDIWPQQERARPT